MAVMSTALHLSPAAAHARPHDPRLPAAPALPPAIHGLSLQVHWARHADELRAAQRLRWAVFAGELGAQLHPPPGTEPGLDADRFDPHCEHLLISQPEAHDSPARVVGTYRVLTPAGARRAGGLYSDGEFDLAPLDALRPHMAELGRACTDPRHRGGALMLLLWSALAQFMQRNGLQHMVGCASLGLRDGGHSAASLWGMLRHSHPAPAGLQVTPRLPLPLQSLRGNLPVAPPPLMAGYLRCGARVLGPPAWDPEFGCADLPLLLNLTDLPAGYRRRFRLTD